MPADLEIILKNELPKIQQGLKKKIKERSKESYQRKEVRGDEQGLEIAFRILLDLFPDLPKDELIHLKPIQEYANGKMHADQSLKEMITQIEGRKRKPGNVHNHIKDNLRKIIPSHWINY